jgi:hypothetical protein
MESTDLIVVMITNLVIHKRKQLHNYKYTRAISNNKAAFMPLVKNNGWKIVTTYRYYFMTIQKLQDRETS